MTRILLALALLTTSVFARPAHVRVAKTIRAGAHHRRDASSNTHHTRGSAADANGTLVGECSWTTASWTWPSVQPSECDGYYTTVNYEVDFPAWPAQLPCPTDALINGMGTVFIQNVGSNAVKVSATGSSGTGTINPGSTGKVTFGVYPGADQWPCTADANSPFSVSVENSATFGLSSARMTFQQSCADGTVMGNDICTNGTINTYTLPGQDTGPVYFVTGGCSASPADADACNSAFGTPACCPGARRPPQMTSCGINCYNCTFSC